MKCAYLSSVARCFHGRNQLHDVSKHEEVRVVQPGQPRTEGDARALAPAIIRERVVTRAAVEENKFRPRPMLREVLIEEHLKDLSDSLRLSDPPGLNSARGLLASFSVVIVDLVVGRHHLAEYVELETLPGVPRTHQAVVDESVFVSEMTRETEGRPLAGIVRGEHSSLEILGVGRAEAVALDPFLGATMTGFAADTVTPLELFSPIGGGDVVAMAVQADFRLVCRLRESETRGDSLGPLVEQHVVGA